MRVSTRGRYGLRILMDVALHQDKGPVALRDISERQAISQKYLWQVINPLKSAGLVNSIRGARGGFVLARPPEEISVRDIVAILEGAVSVVACVKSPGTCKRSPSCTAREAWTEIENKLNDAMRGITLKQLVDRERERAGNLPETYMI